VTARPPSTTQKTRLLGNYTYVYHALTFFSQNQATAFLRRHLPLQGSSVALDAATDTTEAILSDFAPNKSMLC
jgi:hypothetical protein